MSSIRWYGPTIVLLATCLGVMILGPGISRNLAYQNESARVQLIGNDLVGSKFLAELSNDFKKVAQFVEPSVVHIQVFAKPGAQRRSGGIDEEMLRRFFGPRIPRELLPQEPRQEDEGDDDTPPRRNPRGGGMDRYNVPQPTGNGSGWVYDTAGHIITNNHVVDGADKITVRFNDGSERDAKVIGSDPKTDVAVLKIEGGKLIPATLATAPVQQGEIVFAFGSPFRFDFSMSQGIVSAKGRQLGILRGEQGYENFIQTDAAINPGNSGGPLTNIYGQVVGMNSAIASRTGAYNGLGFAIPVDMVKKVADELIKGGKVVRGYLGVYIEDLKPEMAETFDFKGQGVLVVNPIENGPGAEAGLKRGDIITQVDGTPVKRADDLRNLIADLPPKSVVNLQVHRNGKDIPIKVTLGEMPDRVAAGGRPAERADASASEKQLEQLRKLGIERVTTFTQDLAARTRIPFTAGVLVEAVRPDSAAAAAGISRGTIINDVMGERVATVDELIEKLAKQDVNRPVRLSVIDDGQERFVVLKLPTP